jgi:cytochrome bd ubiquinol oxidase subunit I
MDALFLSRLQFAVTPFIHFLFVPLTIGLALMLAIMETQYARTGDGEYRRMAKFWGKLFLINFTIGIVTGIVLEFQFGMNWSRYSEYVGDIFGSLLAIEATGFFFLESTMIGVWIFGWDRLSPRAHAAVMWLVCIATCGSAFWILTANAWMQHPVGFTLRNGRAELTDLMAILLNPEAILSIVHTISASWLVGAFFVMGISAGHLLRKNETPFFVRSLRIALLVGSLGLVGMLGSGDMLGGEIAKVQPAKLAAMESHWTTVGPAPITLLAWPDESGEKNAIEMFSIPGGLSLLAFKEYNHPVTGLKDIPRDLRPPVAITFVSFRMMVAIGSAMVGVLALAWLRWKKIAETPLVLWLLVLFIPLPYIACNTGWILTEVGRQPWLVYGVMKTADGVSPGLQPGQVVFSLITLTILLTVLTIIAFGLIYKHCRKGPAAVESQA